MARDSDSRAPGTNATLPRRGLLRAAGALALGAAGAGALSGCGTAVGQGLAGSQDPVGTLNFWNLFAGGDGTRMEQMEAAYRRKRPGIKLNATTLAWGNPYYTKLALATVGDRPPQVAITHLTRMDTLARAGLLQELHPDDLARHGLTPDRFDPRALERARSAGVQRAIPLDTHPFVLYVNETVARRAGLLGPDGRLAPLEGPDALLGMLRRAKRAGADWGAVMSVNNDPSTCWRLFCTLYSQLGGRLLGDNGATVLLDPDRATRTAAFIQSLTKEGLLPGNVDAGGAMSLFTTGKSAFLLDGEWDITTVQSTGIRFDMVPFPRVFTDAPYAVWADSHALVLPRPPSADPRRLDVALDFVRTLLDNSLTWSRGGHIPAWLPVRSGAAYQHLVPQAHYADSTRGAVYDPPAWYSGAGSTLETRLGSCVAELLAGRATPAGTAHAMRGALRSLASKPSPV